MTQSPDGNKSTAVQMLETDNFLTSNPVFRGSPWRPLCACAVVLISTAVARRGATARAIRIDNKPFLIHCISYTILSFLILSHERPIYFIAYVILCVLAVSTGRSRKPCQRFSFSDLLAFLEHSVHSIIGVHDNGYTKQSNLA